MPYRIENFRNPRLPHGISCMSNESLQNYFIIPRRLLQKERIGGFSCLKGNYNGSRSLKNYTTKCPLKWLNPLIFKFYMNGITNHFEIFKRDAPIPIWFQQPELSSKIYKFILSQSFWESLQLYGKHEKWVRLQWTKEKF